MRVGSDAVMDSPSHRSGLFWGGLASGGALVVATVLLLLGGDSDQPGVLDTAILLSMNGLAGQSTGLDLFADYLQGSQLVKGVFAASVLMALFFGAAPEDRRSQVLTTFAVVFLAVFVARILQMTLPFNPRPLHAEGLDTVVAAGFSREILSTDSSFPSDHAVMYFALAFGVLQYARLAGLLLLIHAIFIISLPRIYLGLHWPSDIAAGAALGVFIAVGLQRPVAAFLQRRGLMDWARRHAALFSIIFFVVAVETATLYAGARHLLSALAEFVSLTR